MPLPLSYSTGVSLGPAYASQAIGYALAGPTGSVVAAWTPAGVAGTTIAGNYTVEGGVPLPADFTGSILWGLSGQTPLASEEITGPVPFTPDPYLASVSLGASHAAQAVGYRLYSLDGSAAPGSLAAFTTSGVVASAVPGDYVVPAGVALPAGFGGRIVWGLSGTDLAEEWLNAPPAAVAAVAAAAAAAVTSWCTDEDVAVRACGDFAQLCPTWQTLAAGADGVFSPDDRWTLRSTTTDFESQGVGPGHVVVLTLRGTFSPSGDPFAVDAVAGHAVTLRRLGKAAGAGQPPAHAAGLTGVGFSCATLDPQIEDASYEVNNLEGVDAAVPGRTPADLYDARELRQLAVLTVLKRQYSSAVSAPNTAFAVKLAQAQTDWTTVRGRLVVKWGARGAARNPTTFLSGRTAR